jgi:hypothetical protein
MQLQLRNQWASRPSHEAAVQLPKPQKAALCSLIHPFCSQLRPYAMATIAGYTSGQR